MSTIKNEGTGMRYFIIVMIGALLLSAPAIAKRSSQPTVTVEELRSMQTRQFESEFDTVFPSVIGVLTDAGYTIDEANKDSGFISASAATLTKVSGLGLNSRKTTPKVRVFIEPRGQNNTQVRISLVEHYYYGYNGKPYRDEDTVVSTSAAYEEIFSKVQAVIARRIGSSPQ